jgi:hypothetical protein
MFLASANAAKLAQSCPKMISFRNLEIPPKIDILVFFHKNKFPCIEKEPQHIPTMWIFSIRFYHMPFQLSKHGPCI